MRYFFLTLLTLATSVLCVAQTPIAHYPFSGNANDAIGTNHGTVNGATLTTDRFGNANSAYSFDGSLTNYITTTNLALTQSDNFTMSAWIKPANLNQIGFIMQNGDITGNVGHGYGLAINDGSGNNGTGNVLSAYYAGIIYVNSGGTFSTANIWYHVVLVRINGTAKFYINGTQTANTSAASPNAPIGSLIIGGLTGGGNFNGAIDEVKIFNTALTGTQVLAEFSTSSTNPLVAHYPFTGNANDEVGSNHGTVNGATLTTDRFGNANSAYSFDGMDDNISCNFTTNLTTAFTTSCWFKMPALPAANTVYEILSKRSLCASSHTDFPFGLSVNSSGNVTALFSKGDDFVAENTLQSGALSVNQWYFITVAYNANNSVQLYINGVQVASAVINYSVSSNTQNWTIGKAAQQIFGGCPLTNTHTQGIIDDVKIYNTALTGAQVLAEFNANAPTANYASQFGNSVTMNGTNDYINIPFNGNTLSQLTIEFWFKKGNGADAGIMQWASNSLNNAFPWILLRDYGTSVTLLSDDSYRMSATGLTSGMWYHMAVTYDGTNWKMLLNGNLIDNSSAGIGAQPKTNIHLGNGYPTFWNGSLDEVRIWNTARSATEIQNNMNAQLAGTETGLVGYWDMNRNGQGAGLTVENKASATGAALNGTTVGTVNTPVFTPAIPPVAKYASQFGNSVLMNGSTDNIDLGTSFTQQNFTVEMWLKPGATQQTYADIIDNNHAGSFTNWVCQQDQNNTNTYGFGTMNTSVAFTLQPNVWQHLTLVKSPTTLEAYINGILINSTPYNGGPINFSNNFLRLGRWGGGGRQWNGSMDEVRFWDYARSVTEIQTNMNSQLTGNETGLVGYWDMNRNGQGAGLTVDNEATATGAALNGTTVGTGSSPVFSPAVAQQAPGSGNAMSFDGVNDYVIVNNLNINPTQIPDLTISLWVYRTQSGAFQNLINNDNGGFDRAIVVNASNEFQIYSGNGISTGIPSVANTWEHILVNWNGNNVTLYKNGIQLFSSSGGSPSAGSTELFIGRNSLQLQPFGGFLDEVCIWNTALTEAQIRDRMCRKITSADQLYANLVAYYNFDETTGSTAFDGSASANNGNLVNGPTRVTSGAAIGNSSAHNYVTTGLPAANLNINAQDNLGVAYTAGTFTGTAGTHIYAVDEAPNTTNGIAGVGTNSRYFGVFNANLTSPTYTATYNYNGNPFVTVDNESKLGLFQRNNNAAAVWEKSNATLNTSANTLTATGQNTEYMLGEVASNQVLAPGSGNAISFDGVNNFTEIPNNPNFNFGLNDNFSVQLWIKVPIANQPSTSTIDNMIIEKWANTPNPYPFVIRYLNHTHPTSPGQIVFIRYNGSTTASVLSGKTFNDDKWHQITCTKNGAQLLFYIDGILTGTDTDLTTGTTSNNNNLYFGSRGGNFGFFSGSLDEVRIWNTALTEAQIRDRMCQKITSTDPLYANLAAYYNFDESTGSTAFDGSANANNGTLVNGPTRVTSGAAIGNSSTHNYVTTGLPAASLSFNAQDNLAVAYTAGTFTGTAGTHVYVVNEAPNTTNGIAGIGTNNRYFGVFNANLNSPTYTATYNYNGNPFVTASNEGLLGLFKRNDNAATTWSIVNATHNKTDKTLTTFGQNTEYMLGTQNSICGCAGENGTLTLTAPAGMVFTGIAFASYGLPTGDCGSYALGSCHAVNSMGLVEGVFLNQNSASISASNGVFGDPCVGAAKRLCVQAVYGPATVNSPGTIGANQVICSSTIPALLTNISSAIGNTANPMVYQWQDSTIGATWQDIATANNGTYQPIALPVSTWFRRKITIGDYTGFTNEVAITVTTIAGDTSVFPLNVWNVYAFNGSDLDLGSGSEYRGFYSLNTLNLNSQSDWASNASPSAATGYQGCSVNTDLFTWVYKRKGFNEGDYIVNSNGVDDVARILVNGTVVYQTTGLGAFGNISLGHLDANSTVEIRCIEATGPAYANFDFILSSLQAGTIAGSQSICTGSSPTLLTNISAGFGGPTPTVTYQWQDSTNGNIWQNINLATNLTYQPGALNTTTWYRRIALSGSAVAASNEIAMEVLTSGPAITPGITVNNRTLTASALANGTIGYQWYKDNVIIGGATNQVYAVPNNDAGQYSVAYTNACGAGVVSAPVAIAIAKTDQTIAFTPVPAKTFGDAAFEVTATASSSLPITAYSLVSGPATMSGNTITITGAGTITVKATQEGNGTFNAAENTLQIQVNKGVATIVLSNLTATYDGTGKQATAVTNPLGLNFALAYSGNAALPVNAGDYNVLATITSPNYQGSTSGTLVIGKAGQSINLTNPGNKSYNDIPFGVTATATSGLPVSLSIQTVPAAGVASIAGNIITLNGLGGTVTITASQAGNTNYSAAGNATAIFEVRPPEAKDMQITTLLAPTNGCELGVLAPVIIRLRNTGTLPASGFPVSYRINNDPVVVETFTGTIAPGANADYTFDTKGIFAQTGVNYQLTLQVNLTGDEIPGNNTLLAAVARYAPATMTISPDTAICAGGEATLRTFGGGTTLWTDGPTNPVFKVNPTVTTTYTATVTDINGCKTETFTVKVTVNANPVVDAGPDQTILRGSSAALTASGAVSYLWNNGITTAENTVSPQATTNFSVTGTNAAGCTATDLAQVVVNFSALTVAPGQVQFGGVVVNNTANAAITITNTGTLPETITAINGLSVPFTTNMVLPLTLPAGTSVQVPVAFNPTATLIYQNKVDVVTTAGTFTITIRGTGVNPAPAWTVTPASYNFGKVAINTNVTQIMVIQNTGNVPIRISSISSSSPRFVGSTSGILDIPVGGSINMSVRFNPIAIVAYSGSISIRSTTPGLALARAIVAGNGIIPGTPPELDFVNRAPFDGNGGVNPPVGNPGFYTYTVTYKSPNGLAPMAGFPKVGIDKNNDEDFVDDNEGLFSMEKEGTSNNWAEGVGYTFTTSLSVSELYGYQFFATDVNGNEATLTPYKKGPVVSREVLDLHIFASDIIFSKANPAVNEDFTVTATINNNSPYAASDIPIRFYYKDSLFLFDEVIPFIDGRSKVSITKTLNFSPDGFYPIKVWIDSSNTLGEGNLLNNYASRPVIVGDFTVPGTIDLVSNATPSGCTKGRITFSGRATYRGLNLAGTPPVEGAEVTISIPGYETGRVLKTTTDINGNWYIYDDPCAQDINPEDCTGYQCGVTYNYTVEVTDFTLTSPLFASSVTRPCVPCDRVGRLRSGVGTSGCILEEEAFTISGSLANYEYDFTTNRKLCAPSIYKDTITFYVDGQLVNTFTLDSLTTCGDAAFTHVATGLSVGNHQVSMNHVYYFANGERMEESISGGFVVLPIITDIEISDGIIKTGHTSFVFGEKNKTCGVPAGPHTVYLYDSIPGYTEKVLIKTYTVASLLPDESIGFSYSNPDLEPGYHYITAYTDEDLEIPELREDNNMLESVFYVQEPDIIVKDLKISSGSGVAGSLINFTATIKNEGSPVFQPFKVQFRVNGSLLGSSISIPSLGTGESEDVVSAPFTVPVSLCPVQITAFADTDNEIVEANEKNNTDTTTFGVNINAGRSCFAEDEETVGAGFFNEEDILGTIQCTPYIAPKGVLTYFATTVRNTGSRDVRNVRVQFKLEGEELGTDVIPLLKAGQKVESGFYYAFDTLGRFIINAFADYTREICETNEKDNIGNIHVDIKRSVSDLEILSQYIAPSNLNPSPGQTITVVSSVVNKGDAPSTPTTMRFWVDDVQLGVDIPIDSLYPGMDTTVMATLTYSSDIVGPKIIKVRADAGNKVIERTKGNNEATRAIIVGAAPDFANAISEAITLSPASFNVGDEITIRNYIRNYGGDAGAAWMRFYYRNAAGEKMLIDSIRFGMESNDSARISMKWIVAESAGQIITEIAGALPPEFNEDNNIDSLHFGVALPLTLMNFNGVVRNEEADLTWRTNSEVNVKHFELERSPDGSRFDKVAIIKANNTSGQHDYSYTDAGFSKLMVAYVYYRLRMVDLDGSYKYSKVVRLAQPNLISTVKVYPNPVKDMLQIQVQSVAAGDFTLRVVDAQGRLMLSRKYGVTTGPQTLTLPVQTLAKGWYVLVMVQADGTMQEVKIIKE